MNTCLKTTVLLHDRKRPTARGVTSLALLPSKGAGGGGEGPLSFLGGTPFSCLITPGPQIGPGVLPWAGPGTGRCTGPLSRTWNRTLDGTLSCLGNPNPWPSGQYRRYPTPWAGPVTIAVFTPTPLWADKQSENIVLPRTAYGGGNRMRYKTRLKLLSPNTHSDCRRSVITVGIVAASTCMPSTYLTD